MHGGAGQLSSKCKAGGGGKGVASRVAGMWLRWTSVLLLLFKRHQLHCGSDRLKKTSAKNTSYNYKGHC